MAEVRKVHRLMQAASVQLEPELYTALLAGLANRRRVGDCLGLLEVMRGAGGGAAPTGVTYNSLLKKFTAAGGSSCVCVCVDGSCGGSLEGRHGGLIFPELSFNRD